jgi:hypothetical protein
MNSPFHDLNRSRRVRVLDLDPSWAPCRARQGILGLGDRYEARYQRDQFPYAEQSERRGDRKIASLAIILRLRVITAAPPSAASSLANGAFGEQRRLSAVR